MIFRQPSKDWWRFNKWICVGNHDGSRDAEVSEIYNIGSLYRYVFLSPILKYTFTTGCAALVEQHPRDPPVISKSSL